MGGVADGASFIGGDAVAALQESFGVLRLYATLEHFEAMLFGGDTAEGLIADGSGEAVEVLALGREGQSQGAVYACREAIKTSCLLLANKREEHGYSACERTQSALFYLHTTTCRKDDTLAEAVGKSRRLREMVHKQLGSRRRCLHMSESHEVEHSLVTVMSDAGDDGERKVGHVLRQGKRIEAGEVAGGATATDYHHTVIPFLHLIYGVQRFHHASLHSLALHHRREKADIEPIASGIVMELSAEVAEASSPFA